MENNFYFELLANKKKSSNPKHIIKEITKILNNHKTIVNISNDSFEDILNQFLLNYVKLIKLLEIRQDEIKEHKIVEQLIDDIITKVENNDTLKPELVNKKIEIEEKCLKHLKEKKNKHKVTISMT